MKPGFKKQPAAIVKMKGNFRPSRYKDDFPLIGMQYLKHVPPYPDSLTEDGQKQWDGIISAAIQIHGYFAVTDIGMFEQLCYTYQCMTEAQRNIKKYGAYRATQDKDIKMTGFMKSYMDLCKMYIALCREFGLSPSSRAGLQIMKKEEKFDPLAGFSL